MITAFPSFLAFKYKFPFYTSETLKIANADWCTLSLIWQNLSVICYLGCMCITLGELSATSEEQVKEQPQCCVVAGPWLYLTQSPLHCLPPAPLQSITNSCWCLLRRVIQNHSFSIPITSHCLGLFGLLELPLRSSFHVAAITSFLICDCFYLVPYRLWEPRDGQRVLLVVPGVLANQGREKGQPRREGGYTLYPNTWWTEWSRSRPPIKWHDLSRVDFWI